MENKQEIEKENEKNKLENELEIKKLQKQETLAKAELVKVSMMNDKDNKVIRDLKKNFAEYGTNSEVSIMVNDLYSIAILGEEENHHNKRIKNKKDFDMIEEIISKLRVINLKNIIFQQIEFVINKYIDDLDYISKVDENKFKSIVNSRKEENKKKKQQAQKIKSEGGNLIQHKFF